MKLIKKIQSYSDMTWKSFQIVLTTLLFSICPHSQANSLGSAEDVPKQPLQELVRAKRAQGPIFVSIPQARVFGDGVPYQPYCSPQIRAINSSYKTLEELVIGIHYKGAGNKDMGSTITRFRLVKVGKDETHYFYSSLSADFCENLTGELEIMRCVYDNGADCTQDVRTFAYGAIPLQIVPTKQGSK
jgi:hypothetical protein